MKINQLKIENFRNHARTQLNLDRINFFVGRNNSGKSSVLAAIEYGFTGRCLWTDRAGRGVAELVRRGEKKAMVAMTFSAGDSQTIAAKESQTITAEDGMTHVAGDGPIITGEDSLVRTLVPHSLQFGRLSGIAEAQTALYNKLNTDEENLHLALNATRFLSLTQMEQKAFLFSACGLVLTPQKVAQSLQDWLTAQGQDADTAARLAQKAYRYSPLDRTGGSEIIEAMEKLARDDRKMIKRDKLKVEKALEEISDCQDPRCDALKPEAIKAKLQELKVQRDQILQALGSSQAEQVRRQNLLARKERLTAEYQRAQQRIQELNRRLAEISESPGLSERSERSRQSDPDPAEAETVPKDAAAEDEGPDRETEREHELRHDREHELEPQLELEMELELAQELEHELKLEQALHAQAAELTSQIAHAKARLETVHQGGEALDAADKRCPLAPDLIPCSMSDQEREQILDQLAAEYQAAGDEFDRAKTELDRIKAELGDRQHKRAEIRAKQAEIQARRAEIQNRQTQIAVGREELAAQHALLQKTAADLEAVAADLAKSPDPAGPGPDATLTSAPGTVTTTVSSHGTAVAVAVAAAPNTNIPAASAAAPTVDDLDRQLAHADQQIRQQEGILAEDGRSRVLAEKKIQLEEELELLTRETAEQELLVKALGADGLPRELLTSSLDPLFSRINDRLGRLTEGAYQLTYTPEMALICRVDGGPLLPLRLLSRSEQFRVGIALQEALSAQSGLRLLAIDESDIFDQDNRDLLAGMLFDTAAEYDQALIFTTVGEAPPQKPDLPGVKLFWVENGIVREL